MASFVSITLFFLYLWGFGYSMTLFVKNAENWLERNLMRIGIGYAGFTIFGVVLNFFGVLVDWRIFLVAALIGPTYGLYRAYKNKSLKLPALKLTKSNLVIVVVLLLFAGTLYMYGGGAFRYAYLEDDDPWGHALGTKYIATEKTLNDPPWLDSNVMGYLDPYPPGYEMLMGVLHQTSPELNWTLKFFNALIISLGIIFFYFFVFHFTGNRNKALFATTVLALLPSYLSHFIWAHVWVPTLFFVIMYAFLMVETDKRWLGITTLVLAGFLLTHQRQPFNLAVFLIIFIVTASIAARRIKWSYILSGAGALIISFLWYLPKNRWIEQLRDTGVAERTPEFATTLQQGNAIDAIIGFIKLIPKYFRSTGGSGTREYLFQDYFFAQKQNMINNPIGIGIFIYLLLFIGVVVLVFMFKKELKQMHLYRALRYLAVTFQTSALVFATILALRYLLLLIGGLKTMPFFFSLWFDLFFFLSAAALGIVFLIAKNWENTKEITIKIVEPSAAPEFPWMATTLGWLVAFFLLLNPQAFSFPFGIEPWRTWMHLATPVSILATEGAFFIDRWAKRFPLGSIIVFTLLLIGMFFTSGVQKYAVNTAQWPPGMAWTSAEEIQAYEWLLTLPSDTKVFPLSGRSQNVVGFNAFSCRWCKDEIDFRERILDKSPEELSSWLKNHSYEYLLIDGMSFKYISKYTNHTENETANLLPQFIENAGKSGFFQPAYQTQGGIILRV